MGSVLLNGCKESAAVSRRPNIIFIYADDWGWGDLSCHGNQWLSTPNLDRLASEGTDFYQFNVNNPVCSPSRTAIMTGHFPARYCVHQHFASIQHHLESGMPDWLDPEAPMLPRMLKEAGYITGHFGKWHLTNAHVPDAPLPSMYGYNEHAVFNGPGVQVNVNDTCDKAIEFIKRHRNEPFFVNLWIHETHTPHWPTDKSMDRYSNLNERQQVYAAVVADGDNRIGNVLDAVDELGLTKNTLVIFSSDNGPEKTGGEKSKKLGTGYGTYYSVGTTEGLRGRKRSLHEGGVRTPFIVRWPGKVPAGKINTMTEITGVDILPTFCAVAGIKLPSGYTPDGENMLEVLLGKETRRTKPIFWEWRGNHSGENWPCLGVRHGKWKLLISANRKRAELYDVPTDRSESKNLADQYPNVVKKLTDLLLKWKAELPESPSSDCFSENRKI
jgi:N-acetylgalactosamine-6-sulfatase